jgi:hypothetical protein
MHGAPCGAAGRAMRLSLAAPKKPATGGMGMSGAVGAHGSAGGGNGNHNNHRGGGAYYPQPHYAHVHPGPDGGVDPHNTTVFVGGLDAAVVEDELRRVFERFGELVYVKIPHGKNCGFVQFVQRSSAEAAIAGAHGATVGRQQARARLSVGATRRAKRHRRQYSRLPLAVLTRRAASPAQVRLSWGRSNSGRGAGMAAGGYYAPQQQQYGGGGYGGYGGQVQYGGGPVHYGGAYYAYPGYGAAAAERADVCVLCVRVAASRVLTRLVCLLLGYENWGAQMAAAQYAQYAAQQQQQQQQYASGSEGGMSSGMHTPQPPPPPRAHAGSAGSVGTPSVSVASSEVRYARSAALRPPESNHTSRPKRLVLTQLRFCVRCARRPRRGWTPPARRCARCCSCRAPRAAAARRSRRSRAPSQTRRRSGPRPAAASRARAQQRTLGMMGTTGTQDTRRAG